MAEGGTESHLEECLRRSVRSYVGAYDRGDVIEQENHARDAGAVLARLLDMYLHGTVEWSPYRWVDDLTMRSMTLTSAGCLEVRGLMIWGEEKGQWLDPFLARLQIATDRSLQTWTLAFGSGAIGLAQFGYTHREKIRQQLDPASVDDWLFVFRKGGIRLTVEEVQDF